MDLVGGLHVLDRPVAAFTVLPPDLNTGAPLAFFQNNSTGASTYNWSFADLGTSEEAQPTFLFPGELEGRYTVCLTAFAAENCMDTVCHDVLVPQGAGLFVPNAFSPDGDGINEVFVPIVSGMDPSTYRFNIFDRWGQPLFSSTTIGEGWRGYSGNGSPVPIGVYVWKLSGKDIYGTDRIERIGHVTLVR